MSSFFKTLVTNEVALSGNVTVPVCSESEVLMLQSGDASLNEVVGLSDAYDRASDTLTGLDMVCDSVAATSNVDRGHMALVYAASQLALSGSNCAREDAIPTLESDLHGSRPNLEGIKKFAKSIWEGMKKILAKIRAAISNFYNKYFGTVVRLRRAASSLRERADNMGSKTITETKTELGSETNLLRVGNSKKLEEGAFRANLAEITSFANTLFDQYVIKTNAVGEAVEVALSAWDWTDKNSHVSSLQRVIDAVDNGSIADALKQKFKDYNAPTDTRFDKDQKVQHVEFIGNFSVFRTIGTTKSTAGVDGVLKSAAQRRQCVILVRPTPFLEKDREALQEGTIATLSTSDIMAICDEVISICDAIASYQSSKARTEISKVEDKLSKTSNKLDADLQKAVASSSTEDQLPSDVRNYVRSALDFNKAYTTWVTEPVLPFIANAQAVCRAALAAGSKCLSNYS